MRSVGVSKISVILLAFATAAVAVSASQVASMGESEQGVMSVTDRPPLAATAPEAIKDAFGKLPLFFEPNRGQADEEVEFLSRGPGHELFLTSTGAVLSLQKPHDENSAAVLGMGLEGANSESRVTGVGELDGKINYIKGNDRAEWRTNVPTYGGVRYEGVYPGIDLLYHGRQGALEYDFELAPGADPSEIMLDFRGIGSLKLDPSGNLVLDTAAGEVVQRAPVSYQEIGGKKEPVSSRYVLKDGNRVGFELGTYDASKPLVIDPVLSFSTYYGGGNFDHALSVAVDSAGAVYITGGTGSSSMFGGQPLPTTPGAFDRCFGDCEIFGGTNDTFVAKFNATGTRLVYGTYLGGETEGGFTELGFGIAVDGSGNAYVVGRTNAHDFPTTRGALQRVKPGGSDLEGFVTKLNPTGSTLVYSTYLGAGNGANDEAYGIFVDGSGRAYVTGNCGGDVGCQDFPTTPGAFDRDPTKNEDAFITKLNATGGGLIYSTLLGGPSNDRAYDIDVDSNGSAYVTGEANGGFRTTAGAFDREVADSGLGDAFAAKLNPTGTRLAYSTVIGSSQSDVGRGIAVDSAGAAYIVGNAGGSGGTFNPTEFPTTPGAFDEDATAEAFVTKFNATGSSLVYSTGLGQNPTDPGGNTGALGVDVDGRGRAYVTGSTSEARFPTTPGAFDRTYNDGADAFVTTVNATGASLAYSTYLGGARPGDDFTGEDDDGGIAIVFRSGAFYVAGLATSTNFPTTPGAFDRTFNGTTAPDAFVAKFTN